MPEILIYQTSDPRFADRVIEAFDREGISSRRSGSGAEALNATIGRWTDDQVSIYIQRESDAYRANEILIELGGAISKPLKLPSPWIVALVTAILLVLAVLSVVT
jgi:hypothetical protein